MLTVLKITNEKDSGFGKKLLSVFKPYQLKTELRRCGDIEINYINYILRRGTIKYDKLYNCCIGKRKTILCDREISLEGSRLKRFTGIIFKKIMLDNFVCDILKKADIDPKKINISYYDPNAENPALAERLLSFCTNLTVVSDMPKFYENESERIAGDSGALFTVSNDISAVSPCDILIAPTIIKKALPTVSSNIIFTIYPPSAYVPGNIITDYYCEFPEKYNSLADDTIDEMYLLAGLYSLCGINSLSELVPHSCGGSGIKYSAEDIIRIIENKYK